MKIALIQNNPIVGDLEGNTARFLNAVVVAAAGGADLAIGAELSLIGYPAQDLLSRPAFIDANLKAIEELANEVPIPTVVGMVAKANGPGTGLHNSAAVLASKRIDSLHHKTLLPTYDVFDERRYFTPASEQVVATIHGEKVGIAICEDYWFDDPSFSGQRYETDPIEKLAAQAPSFLVNLSASPFWRGKKATRHKIVSAQAKKYGLPIAMVNQVGANDSLIFDGGSAFFDSRGVATTQAKEFAEDVLILDSSTPSEDVSEGLSVDDATLRALIIGTKDYITKCGFKTVCLGLSGGIDSALTAVIAKEALGAQNVFGIALPSRYSSDHSISDAEKLATNLGINFETIPIHDPVAAFQSSLKNVFTGTKEGVTEENIQARTRGVLLMALANKFGHLLLTTGNKSELAVGYCTLYGDMCGALAVISDVPKTLVYQLSRHYNQQQGQAVIPISTIEKPPSAELRPGQTDQDSLPPYDTLDAILELFVEQERSAESIVESGFDRSVVTDVIRKVRANEHKRYQASPGLKITSRAFGSGRRMPLAAKWR